MGQRRRKDFLIGLLLKFYMLLLEPAIFVHSCFSLSIVSDEKDQLDPFLLFVSKCVCECVHSFLSIHTHTQPPSFQQQAQQVTGGWGAPMATSTQVPGGGGGGGGGMPSYTGARPDTGLTSLQQQVCCHSYK